MGFASSGGGGGVHRLTGFIDEGFPQERLFLRCWARSLLLESSGKVLPVRA